MAPSPPRPTRATLPTAGFLENQDAETRQPRVPAGATADGAVGGSKDIRTGLRSVGNGVVVGATSSSSRVTIPPPNRGSSSSRVKEPLVPVIDLSGMLFVAPTTADRGDPPAARVRLPSHEWGEVLEHVRKVFTEEWLPQMAATAGDRLIIISSMNIPIHTFFP